MLTRACNFRNLHRNYRVILKKSADIKAYSQWSSIEVDEIVPVRKQKSKVPQLIETTGKQIGIATDRIRAAIPFDLNNIDKPIRKAPPTTFSIYFLIWIGGWLTMSTV